MLPDFTIIEEEGHFSISSTVQNTSKGKHAGRPTDKHTHREGGEEERECYQMTKEHAT